ncbi:AAA family ATPase [Shinella sp. BYT-45]|uniref:AAA family ATPase n=1 Tax=Shinella sp. BYT-45 TaxID=3377377 RepID=UPI0039811020
MPAAPASKVILLVGLPGVGKTTLANALARRIGGEILSRDSIRDAIFPDVYLDYSPEQNHVGTDTLLSVLQYILHRHDGARLIIDGKPFSRAHEVRSIVTLAERHHAHVYVVHCDAPLDVVSERLKNGLSDAANLRAQRTPEKAARIHDEFEPLAIPHLKVDMTGPLDGIVEEIVGYMAEGRQSDTAPLKKESGA